MLQPFTIIIKLFFHSPFQEIQLLNSFSLKIHINQLDIIDSEKHEMCYINKKLVLN